MSTIKFLLLNLPGVEHAVSSVSVNLGIATIAAMLRTIEVEVRILDLNLYSNYLEKLQNTIREMIPQYVGFNMCTPQFNITQTILKVIKDINKNICIICGGAHAIALPHEFLERTSTDIVVLGEGDYTVVDIVQNYPNNLDKVKGICFKKDGELIRTSSRCTMIDLDFLPYPALDLFEVDSYIYPSQSCKKNPVGLIETSRGCPGKCTFCSRVVVGRVCRFKSPKRVVDEMIYTKSIGFNEIHFADDNFTTDIERAIEICNLLIEMNEDILWVPRSGIRVDYVNEKLFKKMRDAGCYHIPYGIESTSQKVLNVCSKGINVEQIKQAIKMAKDHGFEVTGYFMIGLPEQTVDDIKKDIEFVERMEIDFVKFSATIPYPGTSLFYRWNKDGKILTFDWNKYHYASNPFEIYVHPNISRSNLEKIEIGRRKLMSVLNCVLDRNLEPIIESPYEKEGYENE